MSLIFPITTTTATATALSSPVTTTTTTTTRLTVTEFFTTSPYDYLTYENISEIYTTTINESMNNNATDMGVPGPRYNIPQMVILAIVATILSILTVAGNVMVMISFKIDKQLQTISNYFLFSLAIADFAIGLISMPLFSVTTILGYWPLGPIVCDTWLALDYLASNASVLNLLIISFDRYFSVTRPLTYRAKRTTTRAAVMISAAWGISLLLWPPWIYSWPYIEGKRTVPKYECYIQFIETNQYITFGTAIAAFYFPVTIMIILYYRIWRETKKRQKDLPNLQAVGKKDSSKRSNSSDETTAVNHSGAVSIAHVGGNDHDGWRRPRSESSADAESVYITNAVLSDSGYTHGISSRKSSMTNASGLKKSHSCFGGIKEWCIAWWHSGREDSDDYGNVVSLSGGGGGVGGVSGLGGIGSSGSGGIGGGGGGSNNYDHEEPSDLGYATPVSIETPLQSSVSRCTSLNLIRDPYANNRSGMVSIIPDVSPQPNRPQPLQQLQEVPGPRDSRSLPNNNSTTTGGSSGGGGGSGAGTGSGNTTATNHRLGSRSVSQDSVYTILIRLPPDGGQGDERAPSIKMIQDDVPLPVISLPPARRPLPSRDSEYNLPSINRRMSHAAHSDIRIPLNAKIIPKQLTKPPLTARQAKKKKKSQEKRQETKAAKTLSAILLSFIITWTPYNILVLIKPLTTCTNCIPQELWDFFYALCYINSTINPVCYALCNASFRRTYVRILTCKWHTRNREAMTRGVYN